MKYLYYVSISFNIQQIIHVFVRQRNETHRHCHSVSVPQKDGMQKVNSHILVIPKVNSIYEPQHEISNNVVCATSKGSDQPAHTLSLIRAFASRLNIL